MKLKLLAALLLLAAPAAYADVNLPQVCLTPSEAGKPVNAGCNGTAQTGQVYKIPADTDLVRVRSDGATVADWNSSAYVWMAWKDVAVGRFYDTCKSNVAPGTAVTDAAGCSDWGMIARAAPAPTGTGTATLTWTPPTQNTDNSPLTDLAGYQVYSGTVNPPTTQLPSILSPAATSYTFNGLTSGTWWFSVSAVNAAGTESTRTTPISKTIASLQIPTITLSVTPKDNVESATPTLSWGTANATACTASGGWTGTKGLSGSAAQPKIIATTTYTLTCTGPGGSATISTQVNVSARPKPVTGVSVK